MSELKNWKIVSVRIQRQYPLIFRSRSDKRPAPMGSGAFGSAIIFTSTMCSSPAILCRGDLCYSVFFLFFQPSPSFWQSFEPGVSSVLIISLYVPRFVVPKVIGIDLSDDKNYFLQFFSISQNPLSMNLFFMKIP